MQTTEFPDRIEENVLLVIVIGRKVRSVPGVRPHRSVSSIILPLLGFIVFNCLPSLWRCSVDAVPALGCPLLAAAWTSQRALAQGLQ